jgi:hypothetical protein
VDSGALHLFIVVNVVKCFIFGIGVDLLFNFHCLNYLTRCYFRLVYFRGVGTELECIWAPRELVELFSIAALIYIRQLLNLLCICLILHKLSFPRAF